ncbi:MAG: polyprenyl diphosphate synthase [Candidatus Kuenenbacteria bacterium]
MRFKKSQIPKHVAIIMDGNRRWAKKNGLATIKGHQQMVRENIERLIDHSIKRGIKYLTMWIFSTENWKRSRIEVNGLMNLFREVFTKNAKRIHKRGIKINTVGDMSEFAKDIQEKTKYWVKKTKNNNKLVLTFALNYGGRDEILRTVSKLVASFIDDEKKLDQLKKKIQNIDDSTKLFSEALFASLLDTHGLPDPDLIIRLGKEKRMSGFMPWQSVYSEFYFTDALAPEFDEDEYDKALMEFAKRQRRFGK